MQANSYKLMTVIPWLQTYNYKLKTVILWLQTYNYKLSTLILWLQTYKYKLMTVIPWLQTYNLKPMIVILWLQIYNYKLMTANCLCAISWPGGMGDIYSKNQKSSHSWLNLGDPLSQRSTTSNLSPPHLLSQVIHQTA